MKKLLLVNLHFLLASWLTLGAVACGSSSKEDLSYQYTVNDCDTGKHSFASQAEQCAGLQDKTLNKGCAIDLRERQFKAEGCAGTFEEK